MIFVCFLDLPYKEVRIFLNEKHVSLNFGEAVHELLQFPILTQKGQVIERTVRLQVLVSCVFDQVLELLLPVGIGKKRVEENKVIATSL